MPTSAEESATRERLLTAARELLVERGFSRTTTRAVSERAGVNNALVHYHFGTKSQLLVQAALGLLEVDLDLPIRVMRDASSVATGLTEVLEWIGALDVTDPAVRVLIELTIEALRDDAIRPIVAAALADGRAQMTAALAQRPDVQADEAEPLGAMLTALFDGVMLHRMVDAGVAVTQWGDGVGAFASRAQARKPR